MLSGIKSLKNLGTETRLVSHPTQPQKVMELDAIDALIESGQLVLAGGCGGVPVIMSSDGLKEIPRSLIRTNAVLYSSW